MVNDLKLMMESMKIADRRIRELQEAQEAAARAAA